jgi:hypothetical protein
MSTPSTPSTGPDFGDVTSLEKAEELARAGTLERLLLLPAIFGGRDDVRENIVYVPVGLADVKRGIDDNIIAPLARDGKITRYVAEPTYEGDSFIPTAITIVASEPGSFTATIAVWGEPLRRSDPAD